MYDVNKCEWVSECTLLWKDACYLNKRPTIMCLAQKKPKNWHMGGACKTVLQWLTCIEAIYEKCASVADLWEECVKLSCCDCCNRSSMWNCTAVTDTWEEHVKLWCSDWCSGRSMWNCTAVTDTWEEHVKLWCSNWHNRRSMWNCTAVTDTWEEHVKLYCTDWHMGGACETLMQLLT